MFPIPSSSIIRIQNPEILFLALVSCFLALVSRFFSNLLKNQPCMPHDFSFEANPVWSDPENGKLMSEFFVGDEFW
jgi:hypothetical protein